MANKKRGYYTLNIGGKQRVMHFSMNFWANFTDILGISLDKIGDIFSSGVSVTSLRALVYSGLLAYDQEEGNKIDYNEFQVGAWLEDVNEKMLKEMIDSMMESKILGNHPNLGIHRNPKTKKTTSPNPKLRN